MNEIIRHDIAPRRVRSRPVLPDVWTVERVLDRLEEAFVTLGRIPAPIWPRGHANGWPEYVHDFSDLVHQHQTDELERTMRARLRPRFAASAAEIARMEEAIRWPAMFLRDKPEVAQAVGLAALWAARRLDVRRQCKRRGMSRRTFYRRKIFGLKLITIELIRRRVPVS